MTDLALACLLLELPVDPGRLYFNENPYYAHWLGHLVDKVIARRKAEDEKAKRRAKRR